MSTRHPATNPTRKRTPMSNRRRLQNPQDPRNAVTRWAASLKAPTQAAARPQQTALPSPCLDLDLRDPSCPGGRAGYGLPTERNMNVDSAPLEAGSKVSRVQGGRKRVPGDYVPSM